MVLVDTSVWMAHLRKGNIGLESLLNEGLVICHSIIIGELACGNLKNRSEILSLLKTLPMAIHAEHDELLQFIENHSLMGKGLGYVDMPLLASATLSKVTLWTFYKKLKQVSLRLGLAVPKRRPQGANIPYQRANSPTGRTRGPLGSG